MTHTPNTPLGGTGANTDTYGNKKARNTRASLTRATAGEATCSRRELTKEHAAWLADKIHAFGDYAKEAAWMLNNWPEQPSPRLASEDEKIVREFFQRQKQAASLLEKIGASLNGAGPAERAEQAFNRLTQPPSGKMRSADDWHYDYHVRELFSDEREFIKAIQADAVKAK